MDTPIRLDDIDDPVRTIRYLNLDTGCLAACSARRCCSIDLLISAGCSCDVFHAWRAPAPAGLHVRIPRYSDTGHT
eukprot:SAG31_NODE_2227_length_6148_cov_5.268309_5_plen_76_part_00